MNAEYALPPTLTHFCPDNCDIWSGQEYFDQLKHRSDLLESQFTTDFFDQPPCAYIVYGSRNKIVWLSIHPGNSNIHLVQELIIYNDRNTLMTTCTFSRSSKRPLVLAGNSEGQVYFVDLSDGPGKAKVLTSSNLSIEVLKDSKIRDANRVQSSSWIDADNVVCAVANQLVHLNVHRKSFHKIDLLVPNEKNNNRLDKIDNLGTITCLAISKEDSSLMAIGLSNGEIQVFNISVDKKGCQFKFLTSLSYHRTLIKNLDFAWQAKGFHYPLLASVSCDAQLIVWDIFGKRSLLRHQVSPSKPGDKTNFAVGFFPDLDTKSCESGYMQLCFSTRFGELNTINVPKYPSNESDKPFTVFPNAIGKYYEFQHHSQVHSLSILGSNNSFNGGGRLQKGSQQFRQEFDFPPLAVSVSLDRQLIVWDLRERKAKWGLHLCSWHISDLELRPFRRNTVAIAAGEGILLCHLPSKETANQTIANNFYKQEILRQKSVNGRSKITAMSWHPEREYQLACGTNDNKVFVVDVRPPNAEEKYFFEIEDKNRMHVYTLVWGPNIQMGTVDRLNKHTFPPTYNGGGYALYYVASKGRLRMHSFVTNRDHSLKEISDSIRDYGRTEIRWRSDFEWMAVGNDDGSIDVFKYDPSQSHLLVLTVIVESCQQKQIESIVWHPMQFLVDESNQTSMTLDHLEQSFVMAVGGYENDIILIDLRSTIEQLESGDVQLPVYHTDKHELKGHSDRISGLAWSPFIPGRLASASFDKFAIVWDAFKGVALAHYGGHLGQLYKVAWSFTEPDLLLSGGNGDCVHFWRLSKQLQGAPKEPNLNETVLYDSDWEWKNVLDLEIDEEANEIDDQPCIEPTEAPADSNLADDLSNPATVVLNGEGDSIDTQIAKSNVHVGELVKKTGQEDRKKKSSKSKKSSTGKSLMSKFNCFENNSVKAQHYQDIESLLGGLDTSSRPNDILPESQDDLKDLERRLWLYGDKDKVTQLVDYEASVHQSGGDYRSANLVSLLTHDYKQSILKAQKEGRLNDMLVAMSGSISHCFWKKTIEDYAAQLEKSGDIVLAAEYLISVCRVQQAIDLLVKHRCLREALVLAKSRFHLASPKVIEITQLLAMDCAKCGQIDSSIKLWISINHFYEAAQLLVQRFPEPFAIQLCIRLCKRAQKQEVKPEV